MRVPDPGPEQAAQPDRRLHRAGALAARLGDADVQRVVADLGQLLVGGGGEEDVARLHADLELVEVVVLQVGGVPQRAFDQRLRVGFAVFLQQVLLQAAGIDADADRAAVVAGGLHHFLHPLGAADIARIDPQAGGAGLRRLDRPAVVEMDIGHDRDIHLPHDLGQRGGAFRRRAGDPDDIDPGHLGLADLGDGRRRILGRRIGHGLDGDRRVATDEDLAHPDLPRLAPGDHLIGAIAHALGFPGTVAGGRCG